MVVVVVVIFVFPHFLKRKHIITGKGRTLSYTNEELYAQFGDSYIEQIDLWFWGHEHAWTRFAPYKKLLRGRLLGNGGVPVMKKENMYSVKPVPNQHPPTPLSKPPDTFIIRDSIPNAKDIELWCNGLYSLQIDGPNVVVQYLELHNTTGTTWVLEEVKSERETYTVKGGKLE
jgi:hypothetical protein